MNVRFLAAPILMLTLLGAGCAPSVASPVTTDPLTTDTRPQEPPALSVSRPPGDQWAPPTFTPAQTDETWKTYTNNALGFSFQTPTKGRYAPQWEVKVFRDDAREVSAGYAAKGGNVEQVRYGNTPDGQEFFVSYGTERMEDLVYLNDAYSTHIGRSVAVVIFQKKAIAGEIEGCVRAPGQTLWSEFAKPGSCIPFSEEEYFKTLDSIMGTFKTK